ncbi:NUDIX hydrolase [candidate division TM7 genomosp. GTL1]|nr:NUDIX hydrolase [candidate division TM7 genomosp. GTL1]
MSRVNATGYVNAGGRGTRLNPVIAPDAQIGVSKALLKVGAPPIVLVEHQVNRLLAAGVDNVVVGVGDHEAVAAHIERVYGRSDRISRRQLGHGGDLLRAIRSSPQLFRKDVVITNVDTVLDWDELAVLRLHRERRAYLTANLTRRQGVPNEGSFYVGRDDRVLYHRDSTKNLTTPKDAVPQTAYRGSATGALTVGTQFLRGMNWGELDGPLSIYTQIVAVALMCGGLYAFNNGRRFFIDEQQEEIKRRLFKEHGSITPKVGVDAAIMNEDGAVLMLKRSDGAWQMPAGWVDVGESLFGTAQRETFEETGLKIVPLGYVAVAHKTPDKYPGVASQINICVGSQTVPSDSKIILSHEHTDYKWIHDVEEIDNWHIGQKRFFPRIFEAYKDQSFIPGIQD